MDRFEPAQSKNSEIIKAVKSVVDSYSEKKALGIAYSGGLDSAVLLHATAGIAKEANLSVHALYIHHPISDAIHPGHTPAYDTKARGSLMETMCKQLDVELITASIPKEDCISLIPEIGIEAAYRIGRYELLHVLATNHGIPVIFFGHHLADQAESMGMQLLQGRVLMATGTPMSRRIEYPSGYRTQQARTMRTQDAFLSLFLERPLLEVTKDCLEKYAQKHALIYFKDPDNENTHHTRNYLRHRVFPVIREQFPRYERAFLQLGKDIREIRSYILNQLPDWEILASGIRYTLDTFLTLPSVLQIDILQRGIRTIALANKNTAYLPRVKNACFKDLLEQCGKRSNVDHTHKTSLQTFTLDAMWQAHITAEYLYIISNKSAETFVSYMILSRKNISTLNIVSPFLGEEEVQEVRCCFRSETICIRQWTPKETKYVARYFGVEAMIFRYSGYCLEDQKKQRVLAMPGMKLLIIDEKYTRIDGDGCYTMLLRY